RAAGLLHVRRRRGPRQPVLAPLLPVRLRRGERDAGAGLPTPAARGMVPHRRAGRRRVPSVAGRVLRRGCVPAARRPDRPPARPGRRGGPGTAGVHRALPAGAGRDRRGPPPRLRRRHRGPGPLLPRRRRLRPHPEPGWPDRRRFRPLPGPRDRAAPLRSLPARSPAGFRRTRPVRPGGARTPRRPRGVGARRGADHGRRVRVPSHRHPVRRPIRARALTTTVSQTPRGEPAARAPEASRRLGTIGLIWRSLRPRQWLKNLVVVAPLVFAERLLDPANGFRAAAAFLIFCAIAGAVYLFNDLV